MARNARERRAGWHGLIPVAAAVAVLACLVFAARPPARPPARTRPAAATVAPLPPGATRFTTPHFRIDSTAAADDTAAVGAALEALHDGYAARFPLPRSGRYAVVLYRDRTQFRAFNRDAGWAEAYYREPRCHAYPGEAPNRTHWMLHEATHQLMREGSGFRPARWANEGLAAYYGASRYREGRLRPGTLSPSAYPLWWLPAMPFTGDVDRDRASGALIPLEDLLDSDGVDIGPALNRYYVEWWSLAHFLLHADSGRHAAGLRALLEEGGGREAFERKIGPVRVIEREWYAYLHRAVRAARDDRWPAGVPDFSID